MEPQQTEDLPRTPRRISPNLDLDSHVEILEFVEEEDQHDHTMSIKQRKRRKAMKRKRESGQSSEESRKEKWRKKDTSNSQLMNPQCPTEEEQAQAPTEEWPTAPLIALAEKEPSTADNRDLGSYDNIAGSWRAKPVYGEDEPKPQTCWYRSNSNDGGATTGDHKQVARRVQ